MTNLKQIRGFFPFPFAVLRVRVRMTNLKQLCREILRHHTSDPVREHRKPGSHSDQSSSAVTLKSHGEPIDSGQGQKYPHINRMEDFAWVKSLQPKTLSQPVELQRGTGA